MSKLKFQAGTVKFHRRLLLAQARHQQLRPVLLPVAKNLQERTICVCESITQSCLSAFFLLDILSHQSKFRVDYSHKTHKRRNEPAERSIAIINAVITLLSRPLQL